MAGSLLALPADAQPVTAPHAMVATANPAATAAALDVLGAGGSAIDAAIAAQMVLAVVEPQSSGLGGGTVLLSWQNATGGLAFYEGLAQAPAGMVADYAHGPDGVAIPLPVLERSGRVVAVPGTLRVLEMAHRREGRLPWARLFEAAISLADTGIPMAPYLHTVLDHRRDLAGKPGFGRYFASGGAPLPVGTTLHNRALADTMRSVASGGADAFYAGPIATRMVGAVGQGSWPGALSLADLAAYRAVLREPVCLPAFGRRVCSAAPPISGGVAVLQQLGLLERLQIGAAAPGGIEAAHLLLEASRLATADRRRYLGDPDQVPVPVTGLLDGAYLDGRARLVSGAAMPAGAGGVPAGDPAGEHAGRAPSDGAALPATTHVSIVDAAGNAVSMTTTINLNFGSDLVVDGVVLNNALTNFATQPVVSGRAVANSGAPGRRPISTMAPTIVFGADGRPVLVLGAGGGARIIDSVVEVAVGVLAWGQDVRTAIGQPRVGAENRAEELERGTAAAGLAEGLLALGHRPVVVEMNAAVQAVAIGPAGLSGWGDGHRDGVAAGN